jgi:hypothetical protein
MLSSKARQNQLMPGVNEGLHHLTDLGKAIGTSDLKRRGAAAVEFAIIAPLFFMLIFGIVEFGRALMVQQMLTNASREGARQAVVESATADEVKTLVTTSLTNAGITGATTTVTPEILESVGFGDPVAVSISIPYANVKWLPSPRFFDDFTMKAATTMRGERLQ